MDDPCYTPVGTEFKVMNSKILKSLYGQSRTADYDIDVINALYKNTDKSVQEVMPLLPCDLSEEQIKLRYFRQEKGVRPKFATRGTNYNYFFVIGGAIKINPDKQDEIKWVLGV